MLSLFWNYCGLGHATTIRVLQEICSSHLPTHVFLYETKISLLPRFQNIANSMKFDNVFVVPARGSSSGLVLFWKNSLDLSIVVSYDNFISTLIINDPLNEPWALTKVYGPINPTLKPEFWDRLKVIGNAYNGPWCITGDFNAILDQKDKIRGIVFASSSHSGFCGFVDEVGLMDLSFIGYLYTWSNRHAGRANIQEILDRGMCNTPWRLLFPQATVHHLPSIRLDHKPILLHTHPHVTSQPKLFRFEEMWICESSIGMIISYAW